MKDFEASTWFGFFLPKGTPDADHQEAARRHRRGDGYAGGAGGLVATGTFVVPPEHRSTAYLQSIIGPEIEKNGAPLRAAGMSIE